MFVTGIGLALLLSRDRIYVRPYLANFVVDATGVG